ncbi:MAG: Wzz/FepE/Etk N-terminal domain-containing protein [Solirubrobacterales bacterium]
MSETPRYATLRDYLRVIRTQRWLIIGITLAFVGAAFAYTILQTPKYTAEASLSFREIGQDLDFLGRENIPEFAPDQRASINAQQVNQDDVAASVQKALGTDLTVDELKASVGTEVASRTSLVVLKATDTDPDFAAELANAYADQVVAADTREVRNRLDQVIDPLVSEVRGGPTDPGEAFRDSLTQQQIAQLRTLREIAEPVQITTRAEVPDSPSSPDTLRTTALGFVVGLALGLIVAFLRDSLDRRLRQSDDVQSELHLPVVGRVPEEALGDPGFAANGNVDLDKIEPHLEAFRMLRTNLEFLQADSPIRTVLITSGLPEEGKSTVAMALAGAAAVAGKQVLLVECDLRRPSFAERLGIKREPGLTDYLVGRARPADILQVVDLMSPTSPNGANGGRKPDKIEAAKMVCIAAGSQAPLPAELLGSERFEHFLEKVSKVYDFVILDSSPILPVVDSLELVPQVDGMLVCVRLSRTTREEARAAHESLSRLPGCPTGVVVTGVRPGEDSYGYYYGAYSSES